MQFPLFQVPGLGQGMIIGTNAVLHVLISHGVAIGLFAMLVLADWRALRADAASQPAWDAFAWRILRTIVLTAAVAGAVTGTGIWFTTSGLAPRGIGSMLRVFFWAWFTEWIVFFLEVVAILVLYYTWDRLGRRRPRRIAVSFGYAASGFASALLITGNLGFMLTSGSWPEQRGFFDAFLNPTFLPQLITRMAMAYMLGAILALILTATEPTHSAPLRTAASRLFGTTLLVSVPVLVLALVWYVLEVPRAFGERVAFAVLTQHLSQQSWLLTLGNVVGLLAVLGLGLAAVLRRVRLTRVLLVAAAVFAVGFVAQFERIREFIRGPYLMPGYMYVSGVLLEEQARFSDQGMLSAGVWQLPYLRESGRVGGGAYLFSQNCAVCHTAAGVNGIALRARDRSDDGLRVLMRHTQEMTSFMAPLVGTEEERAATARFIFDLAHGELQLEAPSRLLPAGVAP